MNLPDTINKFDEKYARLYIPRTYACKNCGIDLVNGRRRYCSDECTIQAFAKRHKIDWSKYDLDDLINVQKLPFTTVAKMLGVSDNAVRDCMRRSGLKIPITEYLVGRNKK